MFIVIKRMRLILICCAAAIMCTAVVISSANNGKERNAKVLIDAGHGEPDGGAVGADGTKEADLNLAVSKKLDSLLCQNNYKTEMTREDENGIHTSNSKTTREMKREDMKKRAEKRVSSGADIFVSIHMNKFEQPKYCGAQVIYDATNERSKILAQEIQNALNLADTNNTRTIMAANDNIFLLKSCAVPSVIVECGFLSNKAELEKLKSDEYQNIIANAVYTGINNYFKLIDNNN